MMFTDQGGGSWCPKDVREPAHAISSNTAKTVGPSAVFDRPFYGELKAVRIASITALW
jgi:hypothetical protein